jgi:2-polyprenyl-3-methyl-5-hydroxy-6-metoxy-1,4-benzoquinol methylase
VTKEPIEQISKGDPWYVADQITSSQSRRQRRIITDRITFILQIVTEWRDKIGQQQGSAKPLRLLDAGCGDGVLLRVLTRLESFKVYGVDYNSLRVDRAKKNAPEALIREGDLRNIGFEKDFFDVIIMSQVLEHIPEDVSVLKSLARILNRDGILILGVPNEGCLLAQLRNKYLQPSISKTTDHVNFYTEKTIMRKIVEAGLTVDRVAKTGFFFPHQMINAWLASRDWGYKLMQLLGELVKSQVADLHFVCRKSNLDCHDHD